LTVVFFTDRDIGLRFPQILKEAGLTVELHRDHFTHDCPDEEWLHAIGERGWIALTRDRRIRYKPNELEAVKRHRVALLVIVGHAPYPDLARAFVQTLPRILSFIGRHRPPYIAKVYRPTPAEIERHPAAPGRVELWYPK
jgi:hypothetical protein